jgi:cellulose synthase/poly-beta-1,6-N-acetylglucosamine synthase-like glycosyltransferase
MDSSVPSGAFMRELSLGSILLAAIVLVPVLVVCIECVAALLPRRQLRVTAGGGMAGGDAKRPNVFVVIPAHNEELVIGRTLAEVCPMLEAGDRVVVVADNCTDKTVEIASGFPVEVIQRNDLIQIGKGYALDFAARHLAKGDLPETPPVVVVIDADCSVAPGTLGVLADQVAKTNCLAQAVYVMSCPPAAGPGDLVSTLAFLVRNQVRPQGLHRLNLPCSLTGSGMAFPWAVFRDAPLATACIVEDLQLGVELLIRGCGARLCEDARITGILPSDRTDAVSQRTRWEHGHLRLALTQVPRLFASAFTSIRLGPLATALDIAVPPLSLLILTLFIATCAAAMLAAFGGSYWPIIMLLAGNVALMFSLTIAWMAFGRSILPLSAAAAVPRYVLAKVPLYVRFLTRRQTRWVRTPRASTAPATDSPETQLAAGNKSK